MLDIINNRTNGSSEPKEMCSKGYDIHSFFLIHAEFITRQCFNPMAYAFHSPEVNVKT